MSDEKQKINRASLYALLSYEQGKSLSESTALKIKQVNVGKLSYIVSRDNRNIYIAFRGTDNTSNVITDLRFIPWYSKRFGWTHKGFLASFRKLKSELRSTLNSFAGPGINFIFVGHSLGGSICQMACIWAGSRYPEIKSSCISFGAPKVGLSSFGKKLKKYCHIRVFNPDDPVPMLPTSWFYNHYQTHVIKLEDNDNDWIDSNEHSMELYRKLLTE